jgi:hypothetical protein
VAHYGLYIDWIQDLKMLAGNDILKDLSRGPEAYLQMWERAYGVKGNACTTPSSKLSPTAIRSRVKAGMTSWQTLAAIGQPDRRLGNAFTYCSSGSNMKVTFSSAGKVTQVTSG